MVSKPLHLGEALGKEVDDAVVRLVEVRERRIVEVDVDALTLQERRDRHGPKRRVGLHDRLLVLVEIEEITV